MPNSDDDLNTIARACTDLEALVSPYLQTNEENMHATGWNQQTA